MLLPLRSCRVFDDRVAEAFDCGDELAHWLSKFLETDGLRLLYHARTNTQRVMLDWEKKLSKFTPTDKVKNS